MSVNYATFSGSITRNSIGQGVSTNGKAWARFTIAVSSSTYDKETATYKKEPNLYCECVAFGKLATTIEPVLTEGANLLVSGHFTTEGWQTSEGAKAGVNYRLTCENVAVNCVPWQTINVTVNNSNMSSTGSSQTTQSVQQTPIQAQSTGQQAVQQYPVSGSWNTIPMTAQPQYPMSGAAALGLSDDPSF